MQSCFKPWLYQASVHIVSTSINSLWPSDTIWRQRSGSTLAQVMACCLTAPSHYLNQCWLMSSDIHIRPILQEMPQPSITKTRSKITYLKFHSNFPGANVLRLMSLHNKLYHHYYIHHWPLTTDSILDENMSTIPDKWIIIFAITISHLF